MNAEVCLENINDVHQAEEGYHGAERIKHDKSGT